MDTWREILRTILGQVDEKEKRRMAEIVGVLSTKTFRRWADGISDPQNKHYVRGLERAVPLYQEEMSEALREAFPDAFNAEEKQGSVLSQRVDEGIPVELVWRILHAYTTTPPNLQEWTIASIVVEQMVHHLDPDQLGLAVVVAQLVAVEANSPPVITLRNGGGSGIWDTGQLIQRFSTERIPIEHPSPFLLSVLQTGAPCFLQALPVDPLPELQEVLHQEEIKALAICRLQRSGIAVAGALLIGSREEDFFDFLRRKMVERYSELFGLAYPDRLFSPPDRLDCS